MTREELKKEAKTECFLLTVNTIGIDQRDVELAYVMGAEPREKRIAELEKENAELKEQNRNYEQLIDNGSVTLVKERLKNYKQLTKVKEILHKVCYEFGIYDKDLMEEAKQFLSEVEK